MTFALRTFSRAWLALLALLLALAVMGCDGSALAGARDVELTYEVDGADARVTPDLRARVLRRLGAAEVSADVRLEGARVHVVVEERLAALVDEIITWPSGLVLAPVAPEVAFQPADPRELVAVDRAWPDGTVEHAWEGGRGAVLRAVAMARLGPLHRVVAERVTEGNRSSGDDVRYRTRVVHRRESGSLDDGITVSWGDGASLVLRATPGTPAEVSVAQARRRSEEPRAPRDVVIRGQTSLGVPVPVEGQLRLAFGAGPRAYEHAQRERLLLTSAALPEMRPLGAVGLPPDRLLGVACLVIPVLLSVVWLAFVRRFDRAHPEPLWLVGTTFLLGAVGAFVAALVEGAFATVSSWVDPRVVALGGRLEALPLSFAVLTVVVGLTEECAKLAAASFAARRPELDEPVDGIVYAVAAALGFAAAENVRYFAIARLAPPAVIARCFLSVPAHMFFAAIWGAALGARLVDARRYRLARAVLLAAAAHGLFDALLEAEGMTPLALALNLVLASTFILLTRRALRHGVIASGPSPSGADRRLFPVGRPLAFLGCGALVHALAFGLFLLGAAYQLSRHRPSVLFVVGSTLMLLLLAVAALGVTRTMELDVVVDDRGVTFAGATRPWGRILGFERIGRNVVLEAEPTSLVLGPGRPEVLDGLTAALSDHLGPLPSDRQNTLECAARPDSRA